MTKVCYTVSEFTNAFGISKASLYRQVKAGQIRLVKCGARSLITAADAAAWLENLASVQTPKAQ